MFQLYFSLAIFISSWLVLAYNPFVFTWWGVAGAALWTPASILSLAAINDLGLSIAQAVWSGTTIVVSFLWGALVFGDKVSSLPLAILALLVLMAGLSLLAAIHSSPVARIHAALGFSLSPSPSSSSTPPQAPSTSALTTDPTARLVGDPIQATDVPTLPITEPSSPSPTSLKQRIRGVLFALALGILNGSLMVPLRKTPKDADGINYIISFSIGVLGITPLLAAAYLVATKTPLVLHPRVALLPGLLAGFLWQIGNYCSIYATLYLGLTIGYPLTQLALLVAGMWGWLYYKELPDSRRIAHFWLSSIVILAGAALLAIGG